MSRTGPGVRAENTLLYEPDEKIFYAYHADTGLYEVESVDVIRTKISTGCWKRHGSRMCSTPEKRTANTLNNVISHLRGIVERRGAFTQRQRVIHLANGMIVFNGGEAELRPFSPEFRSRNRSPIAFDENARCERFLNELVLPRCILRTWNFCRSSRDVLARLQPAQRLLILDGESARGKRSLPT